MSGYPSQVIQLYYYYRAEIVYMKMQLNVLKQNFDCMSTLTSLHGKIRLAYWHYTWKEHLENASRFGWLGGN
jgi:hypothetical protein